MFVQVWTIMPFFGFLDFALVGVRDLPVIVVACVLNADIYCTTISIL
jgi:hypothetical protein